MISKMHTNFLYLETGIPVAKHFCNILFWKAMFSITVVEIVDVVEVLIWESKNTIH